MCFAAIAVAVLFSPMAHAQDPFAAQPEIFDRHDIELKGRLRHLTIEPVGKEGGNLLAVLEREGNYPDWKSRLSLWEVRRRSGSKRMMERVLPNDAIFYSFIRSGGQIPALVIVRVSSVELYPQAADGSYTKALTYTFPTPFWAAEMGEVTPYRAQPLNLSEDQFFVPTAKGVTCLSRRENRLVEVAAYAFSPKGYYASSLELQPLDLPFWVRGSLWYPDFVFGSVSGKPELIAPWMDEVSIVPLKEPENLRTVYFHRLSETERDDARSSVVTIPEDLDGDGRTDFVVNKFQGVATSLQAETRIYLTPSTGEIFPQGVELKPEGNRAAGATVVDFNGDGKKDLAVVSGQFSVWSIVRALVQKRVEIQFSIYLYHPRGYRLDHPDFRREVSFQFDLTNAEIEGLFPSLDGDFNGDALPDVIYARNRTSLTVLTQREGGDDPFPTGSLATYDVSVPRLLKVADLDGDRKSDVVLFDRTGEKNRRVTVLLNRGVLK